MHSPVLTISPNYDIQPCSQQMWLGAEVVDYFSVYTQMKNRGCMKPNAAVGEGLLCIHHHIYVGFIHPSQ